jgi:hypothetical protein
MFSLPSIKAMNDGIKKAKTEFHDKDTILFYELIELLEKAQTNMADAEVNLQASFHVLYDIHHEHAADKDETLVKQLEVVRNEIANYGHLLRKQAVQVHEAEVCAWILYKEQEKKKSKRKKKKSNKK